ncbi:two-component regulator propeller domain-containing protein [Wenyingzhuangia sp. 1_MG-2023]|nr:two-component regulator propeller domain-containing protein [Wenyingzhuangia sp. 1_MG-2023]
MPTKILKIILALLIVFTTIHSNFAQHSIAFSHLSVNDGLSQSDINTIYQSNDGYMWFGTHDGLNKYDGYNFNHYRPNPITNSLSSNLIYVIVGNRKGNMWIGTTGSGLDYLNTVTGKVINYKHNTHKKNSLRSNYISSLLYDNKNRLWIGTSKGLDMVDCTSQQDSLEFQHIENKSLQNHRINTIYQRKNGDIYAGDNKFIYKLYKENGKIKFKKINQKLGLRQTVIKSITEDKNQKLIVGTSNGAYIENKEKGTLVKFSPISIIEIVVDNMNHIWIGTTKGLRYYKNEENQELPTHENTFTNDANDPNSISKNVIVSLYKDLTGIIWVGTNGGGVNKFDPQRKPFLHIKKTSSPTSLSYNKIRSIFEDSNNTLWIGTEGGDLNMELSTSKKYSSWKHISSFSKTFCLNEIKTNNKKFLLIGSEGGHSFSYIDITNPIPENRNIKRSPIDPNIGSSVFTIMVDHRNYIWIGSYSKGVFVYKINEDDEFQMIKEFSHNANDPKSIGNNIIRNIYEDSKHNIWFATSNGLSKLAFDEADKEKPEFTTYRNIPKDETSISLNYILSLYESKKGELWIGTFGGGINKLTTSLTENKAQFKRYSGKDGLPNDVIKGVLEDDKNNLWISTNNGISKFNPELGTFKNYNIYDGLQSNEFQELACYKKADGEMFFGGINGFSVFYPSEIKDNPYAPITTITKMSLFNEVIEPGKKTNGVVILNQSIDKTHKIELNHFQNSLTFEFAALQYSSPLKNQYAYKLDGFETKWNYTNSKKRFATYTNLAPGNYLFSVKSSNGDGVWNNNAKKIFIKITPPFWKTIWAYIIYVLLIIGLLISFWKFTLIKTEKKHELELEHIEKEKYEELQQMKMEFFTNISHEFRTPLTLIKGPLEYLQKKGKELEYNVIQNQYSLMEKNTDYLLRLVTQLLDFQKMDKGKMGLTIYKKNIARFVKEVAEPFKFISEKKNIQYSIRSEEDAIYSYFSPDALEKVMNNLLSNAFKFCPEGGIVDVYVYIKNTYHSDRLTKGSVYKRVVIEVKDSGSGISEAKKQRIFNRFYSNSAKELANPTGTGIGLSYTKSLIDLHQGSIAVVDNELGGTTFAINIPQEKQAYIDKPNIEFGNETDNVSTTTAYVSSAHIVSVEDERNDQEMIAKRPELPIILVVDDNEDIRMFIRQALQKDYNILEAENGLKGFEIAKKEVPNIIISDYVMPEMDGVEFCKKCKDLAETSHIPFMLLTAKTSKENEYLGLESGADDYITKPFNLESLQLKIKNIISRRNRLRKRFNQEIILKPEDVTVTSTDEIFLKNAMEVVEKNMMNTEFSVEMLVKEMNVSRSNLYLKLKEITGLSSSEFIRSIRLKRAVQLLKKSDLSVKEIMYMTGFNSPSYFAKCFKKQFNMTPSEYISSNDIDIKKG